MTIWILAVLLMASLAGLGYRQGAIRVLFSFVGILTGAVLATPLATLLRPAFSAVGMKHPLLLWLAPPVVVFAVVLITFKIIGFNLHLKVENHYKYKALDLQRILWERLNRRLGLCLSSLNAMAYLVLISFALFASSYWTVQLSASPSDPRWARLLNQLGWDLQSTGMARVGWAVDRLPASFYDAADLVGVLYHTPLIEAQLHRYPAFLAIAEQPEFQDLYNDDQFTQLWQRQAPILELINYPRIEALWKQPASLKEIWAAAEPNLHDLGQFLASGVSQKYNEKILGRWNFDANGSINLLRRSKPNLSAKDILAARNAMALAYAKTTLVAMTDQQVLLKNLPRAGQAESRTLQGQWRTSGSRYGLTFNSDGKSDEVVAEIKNGRLAITVQGIELAFLHED